MCFIKPQTHSCVRSQELDSSQTIASSRNLASVVEFHDPKHGGGAPRPVLGIVKGVEYKAKGGARLQVIDASGAMHAVAEKAIHVNLGGYKGKLVEPSAILADFEAVMALEQTALGVDPESLAMAWELAAEEGRSSFSTKFLLSLVDDKFFKAQIDAYRAFRLLSSDLGKVFFKALGPNQWKVKAAKAVEASKQNWCRELKEAEAEWCLV